MTIGNTTEAAILALVFQAVAWANYADNAASSPQTQIGVSLHTGDPGEAGDASTSETTYGAYTRVNVARNTSGWALSGSIISPVANINFPTGTSGSGSAGFWATAKSNASPPTGSQPILWSGTISPPISVGSGVAPQLTTGTQITLD